MGVMAILPPNDKQKNIISRLRHEAEEKRAQGEAEKLGLPYANLLYAPINVDELTTISEEISRQGNIVIIKKIGKTLNVGVRNPQDNKTQEIIKTLEEKGYTLRLFLISQSGMEKAWRRYKDYIPPAPSLKEVVTITTQELDDFQKNIEDVRKLKEKITDISTTELLKTLVAGAIQSRASDIHLEPQSQTIRLRYRIDGFLQDIAEIKKESYPFLISRVKLLSDLLLNIHNIGQDGRFTVKINDGEKTIKEIDNRVSIIPTGFGESIVIRLLGSAVSKIKLEELGIKDYVYETIIQAISKPNGMILNTGPTGSGKTTTLYAALNFLNKPGVKIMTIEKPIEYKLKGITQTQVNEKSGYTFLAGLKSAMRQDPDIIMVGEIRDKEEADTAIHAALTGHIVFSSIHTNSAAGTIVRLVDIGIDKKIIPSAINAVISQRLVRQLCPKCKEKYQPDPKIVKSLKQALSLISPKVAVKIPKEIPFLYKPKGCAKCFGLGYYKQIGIFEIFTINDKIEKLTLEGATSFELTAAAIEQGMVTLLQDGILKAIEGITSLEEITRVAGDSQYIESLYGAAVSSLLTRSLEINKEMLEKTKDIWNQKEKFTEMLRDLPPEKLLEWITTAAIWARATDIHLEPRENEFVVRYRIDGLLETAAEMPKDYFLPMLADLKILSGMKTEIHKKIQEGRFNIQIEGETENRDTRVSIIPGGYGENIDIRLLEKGIEKLKMETLGFTPKDIETINREIAKPNGIILITGPTSAGKTTTLYAMLNSVNKPGVKILTAEDPIEYRLPGIIQTQINEEEGYTFANALRSFLRQNPNIMLIGEIRDKETADIAIRASLTGHLVFSTIHTNSAVESIQRLLNIGITAQDIASSLNLAIAQRLVRRLCPECREEYTPIAEELKYIQENLPRNNQKFLKSPKLYKPKGCAKCSPTGFKGQIGIFEILINDSEIQNLISQNIPVQQIDIELKKKNMATMTQDGILKALAGITTLNEVRRVTE
jgi:type IV pilus assembly protein PilB